jgi:hypothetical protein
VSAPRRLLALFLALALLIAPGLATWSIVVVNTKTGEVCVAGATCLPNLDLKRVLAVVRVGHGAAAAQSAVDITGVNRKLIWDGFIAGLTPTQILANLAASDPQHQSRQYGIVDLFDTPVTFTGNQAGIAKLGVSGIAGDLRYAIQGNVLTGDLVVLEAEKALLDTPGDLGQKVMAAMEAARFYGGDGRCSCSIANPTQCGSPPPYFRKSAHTAFIALARIGDQDGVCTQALGCANGTFLVNLANAGGVFKPDPVRILERMYKEWRQQQIGRADQVKSFIAPLATQLPPDGSSQTQIEILLSDLEGGPVDPSLLTLSIEALSTTTPVTTPGAVQHWGGGRYTIPITAGTTTGTDTWRVWVTDAQGKVALQPDPTITVAP